MLGNNIKKLRKQKGYSQETLAEQLHIVRQTVSKWEKGTSVPDAVMLNLIAELFEVSVSQLLGDDISDTEETSEINEVAKQLAILNEQFANRSQRRRKTIKGIIIGVAVAMFLMVAIYVLSFGVYKYETHNQVLTTVDVECSLDGETYLYEITYNENYQVIYAGGDAYIANHVQTEQYDDANILIAQIEDYFKDRGGTCVITDNP